MNPLKCTTALRRKSASLAHLHNSDGDAPTARINPQPTCHSPAVYIAFHVLPLLWVPSTALYVVEFTFNRAFKSYRPDHSPSVASKTSCPVPSI